MTDQTAVKVNQSLEESLRETIIELAKQGIQRTSLNDALTFISQQLAEQTSAEPIYEINYGSSACANWQPITEAEYLDGENTFPKRKLYTSPPSVEVLLEALRPFAAFADHYPIDAKYGNRPTSGAVFSVASKNEEVEITVEDFHRAKAALSSYKPTEG
jgi:hypothetical protein